MRVWGRNNARIIALIGYLLVLAAVCAITLLGSPLSLLIVAVLVPALASLRARMALSAALALAFVAFLWTGVVILVISRYTFLPPIALVIAAALVAGVLSAVHLYRRGSVVTRADIVDLGFAGSGALVWCAVLLAAQVLPGGSPLSWAMTGDSANNVLFARRLLEEGGISVGAGQNPVPLTAGLIALFTLPAASSASYVGAQIASMAEMWSFSIAAACLLCGALALELIRRRTALGMVGVAITSALPLGWLILTGPVLLGFVNFHTTIAILVACLVVLIHARKAIVASFVTIALGLAAVLALWAPLAGIPMAAMLVLLIRHRRVLFALRGLRLAVALVALAQPIWLFFALSLPSLLNQGGALQESNGAVFEFRKILFVIVAALAIGAGLLHARVSRSFEMIDVLIAVVAGGGVCLAALLWIRRHEENLWSYYQLKFLWFFMALLLIVGVAAGMGVAGLLSGRRPARSALAAVVVLTTLVGVSDFAAATVPTFSKDPVALKNPMARILAGDFFGVGQDDRVFDRVVELMDADEPTILWKSGDPDEDWIMFWVVQMSASSIDDIALRKLAYYHDANSMEDLCAMRELIGPPVRVLTADQDIVERVEEACGDLGSVDFLG